MVETEHSALNNINEYLLDVEHHYNYGREGLIFFDCLPYDRHLPLSH